jgi:hypothetical protein
VPRPARAAARPHVIVKPGPRAPPPALPGAAQGRPRRPRRGHGLLSFPSRPLQGGGGAGTRGVIWASPNAPGVRNAAVGTGRRAPRRRGGPPGRGPAPPPRARAPSVPGPARPKAGPSGPPSALVSIPGSPSGRLRTPRLPPGAGHWAVPVQHSAPPGWLPPRRRRPQPHRECPGRNSAGSPGADTPPGPHPPCGGRRAAREPAGTRAPGSLRGGFPAARAVSIFKAGAPRAPWDPDPPPISPPAAPRPRRAPPTANSRPPGTPRAGGGATGALRGALPAPAAAPPPPPRPRRCVLRGSRGARRAPAAPRAARPAHLTRGAPPHPPCARPLHAARRRHGAPQGRAV